MCHPYPGGLLAELGQEVVVEHAHTRSKATQDVEQVGLRRGGVRAHVGVVPGWLFHELERSSHFIRSQNVLICTVDLLHQFMYIHTLFKLKYCKWLQECYVVQACVSNHACMGRLAAGGSSFLSCENN